MFRVPSFESRYFLYPVAFVLRPRTLLPACLVFAGGPLHACSRDAEVVVTQLEDSEQAAPYAAGGGPVYTLRLPPSRDGSGHWTALPVSREKEKERRFAYLLEIEYRNPTFQYFAGSSHQEIMEAMDAHLRDRYTYSDLFDGKGTLRMDEELVRKLSTDLAVELFASFRKVSPQDPLIVSVRLAVVQTGATDRRERARRMSRKAAEKGEKPEEDKSEHRRAAVSPGRLPEKSIPLQELDENLQTPSRPPPAGTAVARTPPPGTSAAPTTPDETSTKSNNVIDNPYR